MTGIALAGDEKTRVQAVVDWFGPIDFARMDSDMAKLGRTGKMGLTNEADSPESKLIGAAVGQNPEKAFAASPLFYLSKLPIGADVPPFLIMHGADDPLIAPGQSQRLYRALIKRGGPDAASLKILPGSGHGDGQFADQSSEDAVVAFFKKNLQR
jgi:dipeptidyl aminopeptidase/acylaminoacyl peptidase